VLVALILVWIDYWQIIRLGCKLKTLYEFVRCVLVFYDIGTTICIRIMIKYSHITEKLKYRENINEQTHIKMFIFKLDNKQIYIILLNVNCACL